jgi:hypothetical protein
LCNLCDCSKDPSLRINTVLIVEERGGEGWKLANYGGSIDRNLKLLREYSRRCSLYSSGQVFRLEKEASLMYMKLNISTRVETISISRYTAATLALTGAKRSVTSTFRAFYGESRRKNARL